MAMRSVCDVYGTLGCRPVKIVIEVDDVPEIMAERVLGERGIDRVKRYIERALVPTKGSGLREGNPDGENE